MEPEEVHWFGCASAIAIWLASGLAGFAATCQTRFEVSTNYYPVTGQTRPALLAALHRARAARTNENFDASTIWTIKWTYLYSPSLSGVHLDSVQIAATIDLTLPRWTSASDAPETLLQSWQRYYRGLAAHEAGHAAVVRDAVKEMQRQFTPMTEFESPTALLRALDNTGSNVVESARQRERQYDVQTRHGLTQGAVWR